MAEGQLRQIGAVMRIAAALASTVVLATGAFGQGCSVPEDCADQQCQTKACTNGECVYAAVVDGLSPNQLCATRCCGGGCCAADATSCNEANLCCVPNCAGRECGPDGCGRDGSCGTCPQGETCNAEGQCGCDATSCPNGCCETASGPCQEGNTNQFCGTNGVACGTCTGQEQCRNGQCLCVPNCAGKQCGPDGCLGDCGSCPQPETCNADGQCICVPNCQGKACGPDGCGESCGTCPGGEACDPNGQCTCVPSCQGKQCGPNACGGQCPPGCTTGQSCSASGQCIGQANGECANLANCRSLAASSWLVVPAGSTASPSLAGTVLFCPDVGGTPQLAVGSDYLLSGSGGSIFKLFVNRYMAAPGVGLTAGPDAGFFVSNYNSVGFSIKPIVGCVTNPLPAVRDSQQSQLAFRVLREEPLRPSRRATYEDRCQDGEILVNAVPGVLFHTQEAPSAGEVRQVRIKRRIARGRIRVDVRTGPSVGGDDERVTLQIIAACSR